MNFLGTSLTFVLVYIWARRNPFIPMTFLGLFNFSAPFLPWVLLGFSLLLSNSVPYGDVLGIIVGHVYYFLEDVYPQTSGRRPLKTPGWFKRLVEGAGVAAPQQMQLAEASAWNEAQQPIEDAQPPAGPLMPQPVQSSSALRSNEDSKADSNNGSQVRQRHLAPIEAKERVDKEDWEQLLNDASSGNLEEPSRDHSPSNSE